MTPSLVPPEEALRVAPESWLDELFTATAWDPRLKRKEHAALAVHRVLAADQAWAAQDDDGHLACAWLSSSAWDCEFFGVPMAVLGLEGHLGQASLSVLLPRVLEHVARAGIQHVRVAQRAGATAAIQSLQDHGFQVRWASVQIACDTRALPGEAPACPSGLRFVDATEAHVSALVEASARIGPYCWPEFTPALPTEARRRYVAQRIENCILTDYASTALVALWRDTPVGLHAAAILEHEPSLGVRRPFGYVRETFVAPDAPPRLGAHLIRAALHRLRRDVQLVTGRVRLDGRAMLNTALSEGHAVVADEILLDRSA